MPKLPPLPKPKPAPKKRQRLGFYSRKSAALKLDRRSSEAKILAAVATGLEDELGGPEKVSFRQHLIIKIAADLALRHQLAIGRYVRDADDDRQIDLHVTTLANSIVKALKALDVNPVQEVGPTLAEYLAAKPAVLAE